MSLLILFFSLSLLSLVTTIIYIVFKYKYASSNDSSNYRYYLAKCITLLVLIVLAVIFTFDASYFVAEPLTTMELTFKQISYNSSAFSLICLLLITNKKNKVEPGIYIPGLGGFRYSDTLLITEIGYQKLTKAPEIVEDLTIEV